MDDRFQTTKPQDCGPIIVTMIAPFRVAVVATPAVNVDALKRQDTVIPQRTIAVVMPRQVPVVACVADESLVCLIKQGDAVHVLVGRRVDLQDSVAAVETVVLVTVVVVSTAPVHVERVVPDAYHVDVPISAAAAVAELAGTIESSVTSIQTVDLEATLPTSQTMLAQKLDSQISTVRFVELSRMLADAVEPLCGQRTARHV